jgi:AraC family transcriptional regulator, regulatory protein of adaptative response / methylphosphotriester-DNA alkyltransferase methyltransferase
MRGVINYYNFKYYFFQFHFTLLLYHNVKIMPTPIPQKILIRKEEITATFLAEIDKHLQDILNEKATEMMEIKDFAALQFIHPTHLSNTIKLVTGKAPCDFYEEKILSIAKQQLEANEKSINDIALSLTYDPSNFTKFFKRFTGTTPKQYRMGYLATN